MGTELTLNSPSLKPLIEQWNAMAPMGRMGRPEELQSIAVYLAGDTSSFTLVQISLWTELSPVSKKEPTAAAARQTCGY